MKPLLPILQKEFLLIRRDIHALLILFVMPTAFILIMSLSLQEQFQEQDSEVLKLGVKFEDPADIDEPLGSALASLNGYEMTIFEHSLPSGPVAEEASLSATIYVSSDFHKTFSLGEELGTEDNIEVQFAPDLPNYFRQLIVSSINQVLHSSQIDMLLALSEEISGEPVGTVADFSGGSKGFISETSFYEKKGQQPNSVEQTVPAWLIFAMFFVVIPLSTTFLIEKHQGTLQRLKTLPVANHYFLLGKLLPYLLINLVQMVLMFLVGILLLPAIGGDGIRLGANAWLLIPMSLSISFLAVSFALLIAVFARTTEQATTIGGVSNLILAALGGIMVPTFVMPEIMQSVARISPMNWGLEGYLSIILRQANFADISLEISKLIVLGMFLFLSANYFYGKRSQA